MSDDISAAAPAAESAPSSTADIASTVIDSYEGSESTDGQDGTESAPVDSAAAPVEAATPGVVQPPLSEEEKLLEEFGFKDMKKPDGRDHYIPRPKVLKMIASGLKRGQEKWAAERTSLESGATELRSAMSELRAAVSGDPKAFLAELAGMDPRYQAFLEPQAPAHAKAPVSAEMPGPDVQLPNGGATYSVEGLKKLLEWNTAQVESRLLGGVDERLKPWTEREKQAQEREKLTQAETAVKERTQSTLKDAQSWPLFGPMAPDGSLNDVQAAVLEELRKDSAEAKAAGRPPRLSLSEAYIRVTSSRFTEDDNKRRARILKEVSTAAKATPGVPRSADGIPKAAGPASTADIARRTLERLESGA
jgi:hypothetical protein